MYSSLICTNKDIIIIIIIIIVGRGGGPGFGIQ